MKRFVAVLAVAAVLAQVGQSEATVVQFNFDCWVQGPSGPIDNIQVELYDAEAPATVANFLQYVNNHEYDGSFIHRGVQGFVIQGGGFRFDADNQLQAVPSYGAIPNEFNAGRSNARGTIAMAKLADNPDSATNQWFFNLADNNDPADPLNLDTQNGGFTVFGHVLGDGMLLADGIGNLPTYNYGEPFSALPLIGGTDVVLINSVTVVPEPSTFLLLGIGAAALLGLAWRRRRA